MMTSMMMVVMIIVIIMIMVNIHEIWTEQIKLCDVWLTNMKHMSLFYFLKSKHRKYNISLKMLDWENLMNQQTVGLQRQRCGISIEGNDHVFRSFAIRKVYLLPILDLVISYEMCFGIYILYL
jgi:hypothetical protein